jgi:hypothetical protein
MNEAINLYFGDLSLKTFTIDVPWGVAIGFLGRVVIKSLKLPEEAIE